MDDVRVIFGKWGGRPHWEYDAVRLGDDAHGVWLGVPAGSRLARPGADFLTEHAFVVLVPTDSPFTASFYDDAASSSSGWVEVYVDITTVPVWDGSTVHLVDLDLDVVKGRTGRVWVDDEDEFADHRVRFGYPAEVVELAVASCEAVRRAVTASRAPFDATTSRRWLDMLEGAMMA
jgi:hypothetical protein